MLAARKPKPAIKGLTLTIERVVRLQHLLAHTKKPLNMTRSEVRELLGCWLANNTPITRYEPLHPVHIDPERHRRINERKARILGR